MASSSSAASSSTGWNLVWSDDFNGSNLDTSKWSFERNCTGGGNNEQQCYTDRAANAFLSDGQLHLVAIKETFSGQARGDDDPAYNSGDTSVTLPYTSARLRSKNKGDWKYGRMDIRAKLPQGQGIWPAIWMLPTDWVYGSWPLSGEIDIMEAVNSNTAAEGNKIYGTLHFGDAWPNNKHTGTNFISPSNVWDELHTYSVEWEEGEIRFYVDDTHYATQTKNGWYSGNAPAGNAPFDQKFHMILNVAVGGQWPGNPDASTVMPQEMTVDYVHVYECAADPVTGKGCASHVNPAITPLTGYQKPAVLETLTSSFDVFVDAVDARWDNGATAWNSGSFQIQTAVIDSDVPARGKVLDIQYGSTSGVAYIQAKGPKDVSVFTGASYLEFDVKVLNYGTATGLIIKADCGNPCGSGDIPIGKKGDGVWETVQMPISTLVAGGLNLTKLDTPLVIFPTWGAQAGVELQLDNIHWVLVTVPTPPVVLPTFPITFDDAGQTYVFSEFGGAPTVLDVDPENAANQVAKITKSAGAQTWAGVTISTLTGGKVDTIPLTSKNISLKVWSPKVGAKILVKSEDAGNGTHSCELAATTTQTGWQTLVFDFVAMGCNAGYTYNKLSVFPDFSAAGVGDTYYVDDIKLVAAVIAPPTAASFPMTFSDTGYILSGFGDSNGSLATDPDDASNGVFKVVKSVGAQTWAGVTVSTLPGGKVDATPFASKNLTLKVYAPAGINVLAKTEDAANGANNCERQVTTTVAGWQVLQFNFAGFCNAGFTYNRLSVFPGFGVAGAGETYYVDDITVVDPAPAP